MQESRRRLRGQARSALVWMVLSFVGGHLLMGTYLHYQNPDLFDPEITFRLRVLSRQLAESPGRPLALFLGSSRMFLGLRPSFLNALQGELPGRPLAYNFGLTGGGPVSERLVLQRLLSHGIRPQWLFIEVWPPFLPQKGHYDEESIVFQRDLYWSDLPILARLYPRLRDSVNRLLAETFTPLLHYRIAVLNHYAPELATPGLLVDAKVKEYFVTHLDRYGTMVFQDSLLALSARRCQQEQAQRTTKPLFEDFQISDISRQAMHELLETCRANDIRVALVLMPEHSMVRGWYPQMQSQLLDFLKQLSRQYNALVLDTRAWHPDEDLPDFYHLSSRATRGFSERFGREIYRPLLQGQPLAAGLLVE